MELRSVLETDVSTEDLIRWIVVLPLSAAIAVGTLAVFGFVPDVYTTYAGAVFTLAFSGMLFSMVFVEDKQNEQVMADSTALMLFSGFQAIPIGFFIGELTTGFTIWLGLTVVASIHGHFADTGYTPYQDGDELCENIRTELMNAANSDDYQVPDDPQDVLRNTDGD